MFWVGEDKPIKQAWMLVLELHSSRQVERNPLQIVGSGQELDNIPQDTQPLTCSSFQATDMADLVTFLVIGHSQVNGLIVSKSNAIECLNLEMDIV